jgi:hypothetical protein
LRWQASPRVPIIPRVRAANDSEVERLLIEALLGDGGDADESGWIRAVLAEVEARPDYHTVARPYAAAARRLRALERVAPTSGRRDALERLGLGALACRGAIAMFRALLLLVACRRALGDTRARLVDRLFRTGDSDERIALLAVLPALPGASAYVATAVEACRSNVRDVFEAIACENEYPARHFSAPAFNQMVMKAIFWGVSLARVRGLSERQNADLERMARDYGAERRSAGREVPADLSRLLDAAQGET